MKFDDLQLGYETTGNLPVLYIAGPMTGYEEWNFPSFNNLAYKLREFGFPVLNPADFGLNETDWATCMSRDLPLVAACQAIILLPGWEDSKGANLEFDVAMSMGKAAVQVEITERFLDFLRLFFTEQEIVNVMNLCKLRDAAIVAINEGVDDLYLISATLTGQDVEGEAA